MNSHSATGAQAPLSAPTALQSAVSDINISSNKALIKRITPPPSSKYIFHRLKETLAAIQE